MAEINVTSNQVNSQNVDTIKYNQDDINLLGDDFEEDVIDDPDAATLLD